MGFYKPLDTFLSMHILIITTNEYYPTYRNSAATRPIHFLYIKSCVEQDGSRASRGFLLVRLSMHCLETSKQCMGD